MGLSSTISQVLTTRYCVQWVTTAAQEITVVGAGTEDGTDFAELKRFETMIENVSNSTSKFLIRTLMEDYRLLDHCQALKRYLLLGQV